MMSDCIDRAALLKDIEESVVFSGQTPNAEIVGANKVISRIKSALIADVAPVVHGRWENGDPICPVCGGNKFKDLDADIWCDWQPDFCPNCGAKMDLEE